MSTSSSSSSNLKKIEQNNLITSQNIYIWQRQKV
jgi:hypothetical protein